MKWSPRGFGGNRRDPDTVKREGWHEQGLLVISAEDPRLSWPDRELVRQLGSKLYGERKQRRQASR